MQKTRSLIFLIIFGLSCFTQNPTVRAQVTPPAGPAGLGIDPAEFKKAIGVVLRRVSEVDLELRPGTYGFRAKGAFVFGHEMAWQDVASLEGIERDTGPLVLPYEYSRAFTPDGQQRLSFSVFKFHQMNEYIKFEKSQFFDASGGSDFSSVNELEFLNLTWDQNYTFSNLKTIDLKLASIELRPGFDPTEKTNFVFRAAADIGVGTGSFTQPDGMDYTMSGRKSRKTEATGLPRHSLGVRFNYSAGLEFDHKTNREGRLNIKSSWVGGWHQVRFVDPNVVASNLTIQSAYDARKAQYEIDRAKYEAEKSAFDDEKNQYWRDHANRSDHPDPKYYDYESYSKDTGKWPPDEPTAIAQQKYPSSLVSAPRVYGLVKTSLSYDRIINRKRLNVNKVSPGFGAQRAPVRLGFEIEWNVIVKDKFKNPPEGTKYDFQFKDNFNRQIVGRIIFKF